MRLCARVHCVREASLVPRPLRARSTAGVPVRMSAAVVLPDGVDDEAQPSWVTELSRRQGITQPASHRYWEQGEQQPHGPDTVVAWLHEGPQPALRTARVFLEQEAKRVYGVLHLGQRVCGHPGLVHGGVTALMLDEMFGQAYWAWIAGTRGGGFTANLSVDYKAPVPSSSWICVTVDLVSVEGRKVRLAARVTSSHEEDATLFAAATCLFIVAAKD